jgi:hypothetical protein
MGLMLLDAVWRLVRLQLSWLMRRLCGCAAAGAGFIVFAGCDLHLDAYTHWCLRFCAHACPLDVAEAQDMSMHGCVLRTACTPVF